MQWRFLPPTTRAGSPVTPITSLAARDSEHVRDGKLAEPWDFQSRSNALPQSCYSGRENLTDLQRHPATSDWRHPSR